MREAISKMPEPEVPEDEVGAIQIDSPTDEVATTQLDSPTEKPEIKIGPNVKLEPGTKGVKLKIEPGIELEKPTIEPEIKIEPKAESELKTGKGKGKGKTKKKGTPPTDDIGGKNTKRATTAAAAKVKVKLPKAGSKKRIELWTIEDVWSSTDSCEDIS